MVHLFFAVLSGLEYLEVRGVDMDMELGPVK
jgi:hypothetical protein